MNRLAAVLAVALLAAACASPTDAATVPAPPPFPPSLQLRAALADGDVTAEEWEGLVDAFVACADSPDWDVEVRFGTAWHIAWTADGPASEELIRAADTQIQQCSDRFLGEAASLAPPPDWAGFQTGPAFRLASGSVVHLVGGAPPRMGSFGDEGAGSGGGDHHVAVHMPA